MKVKRYMVRDMNEAMIRIKNELGLDAVILNTRKVKKTGIFGFFKKPMLEVVAAIDEPSIKQSKPRPSEIISPSSPVDNAYLKELDGLKSMVASLVKKVEELEPLEEKKVSPIQEQEPKQESKKTDEYIKYLRELNIQDSISRKILEIVKRQISIDDKNNETVVNAMKVIAREYLGDIKTIEKDGSEHPNIYVFLGPTGVGKTTTLAKIAAKLSLVENKSIGLITADTYRIAAVEQLKTYSEILGLPLEVVYEADELNEAIEKFKDKDYILIDTAGRSHKSKQLKSDFEELVKPLDHYTVFLVMSLTTGYKEMKNMISSYHFLKDYRLLFTKLDEATSFGNILNIRVLTGKALSYFTIGQSVPDDIEDADKEKVIQYIFDRNYEELG